MRTVLLALFIFDLDDAFLILIYAAYLFLVHILNRILMHFMHLRVFIIIFSINNYEKNIIWICNLRCLNASLKC